MTKKKSPQAPKSKWRYGVVKRTYKTVLPTKTFTEVCYELVEVYDQGKAYTENAVPFHAGAGGVNILIKALERAVADLKKYDVIVEKKVIVRRIGGKKK